MDTEKQPERTIVVRAVYIGETPALSRPKEPFFLGDIPIIEPITKGLHRDQLAKRSRPFPNVEILQGSRYWIHEEEKAGVSEGTVLVIYDVPISKAEKLREIEFWRFERLSWTKYREVIDEQYKHITNVRDALADKLTTGWARFFGLELTSFVPQVTRIDVWMGKHAKDREYQSTDRYHYHLIVKAVKVADLFNAVEYIEQGFFSMGVDCEVAVTVNTEEVYRSPKGLTDEPKT